MSWARIRPSYKGDLQQAQTAILELNSRIKDIKGKAEQSEVMVQEICRDIKKLDYAKRHLTGTITALRRLSMLVSAVEQLETMVGRCRLKPADPPELKASWLRKCGSPPMDHCFLTLI
jgi:hypothetical protein